MGRPRQLHDPGWWVATVHPNRTRRLCGALTISSTSNNLYGVQRQSSTLKLHCHHFICTNYPLDCSECDTGTQAPAMMRGGRIVNDGLWRCLCPAFDRLALNRALHTYPANRTDDATPSSSLETNPEKSNTPESRRERRLKFWQEMNIGKDPEQYARRQWGAGKAQRAWDKALPELKKKYPVKSEARSNKAHPGRRETTSNAEPTVHEIASMDGVQNVLKAASERQIKLAIIKLRDGYPIPTMSAKDRYERIVFLSQYLVKNRNYVVDAFIYESIMAAMAIPETGSSEGITRLIQDMEKQNVQPTLLFCQLALAANTVHPSYLARHKILAMMKEHWLQMDTRSKQSIIISMLRERQYENAFDRLVEMAERGDHIDGWVFDIFIMVFAEQRFLDEILVLLSLRKEKIIHIPVNALHVALDAFSSDNHYEGTLMAWKYLDMQSPPGDKVLCNMLNVAARHGDSSLASEMFGLLSQRIKLQEYHYEAVAEAFIAAQNVEGALRTYAVAHNSVEVDEALIARFETMLMDNGQLVGPAEQCLQSLLLEFELPAVVIECVMRAKVEHEGVEAVLDLVLNQSDWAGVDASPSLILDLIGKRPALPMLRQLCEHYKTQFPLTEDDPKRPLGNVHQLIIDFTMGEQLDIAFRWANQYLDRSGSEVKWVAPLVGAAAQVQDGRLWEIEDRIRNGDNEDVKTAMRFALRQQRVGRQ